MRSIFDNPVDPKSLDLASQLAEQIYALHQAASPYETQLSELSTLVGSPVTQFEVDSAFGSVNPRSFAFDLLVRSVAIPGEISRSEMLEMLQHLLQPKRGEVRDAFWLACLTRGTGDSRISDLIYWPGEYFKDGNNNRELSAEEILHLAEMGGRSN